MPLATTGMQHYNANRYGVNDTIESVIQQLLFWPKTIVSRSINMKILLYVIYTHCYSVPGDPIKGFREFFSSLFYQNI